MKRKLARKGHREGFPANRFTGYPRLEQSYRPVGTSERRLLRPPMRLWLGILGLNVYTCVELRPLMVNACCLMMRHQERAIKEHFTFLSAIFHSWR